MVHLYSVTPEGDTFPLERVHCRDEARELQELIARNPALLPGEQINPESPRRWIVIK